MGTRRLPPPEDCTHPRVRVLSDRLRLEHVWTCERCGKKAVFPDTVIMRASERDLARLVEMTFGPDWAEQQQRLRWTDGSAE